MGLTPTFSTPAVCSRIFHSCIFRLCDLLLHFPPLQLCLCRIFHSRIFSRPATIRRKPLGLLYETICRIGLLLDDRSAAILCWSEINMVIRTAFAYDHK